MENNNYPLEDFKMEYNEDKKRIHKDTSHESLAIQQELLRINKKQLFHSRLVMVFLLCLTIGLGASIVTVTPKLNRILSNLDEISEEINVQDPIDVETLNDTLQELNDVLNPLANLFNSLTN